MKQSEKRNIPLHMIMMRTAAVLLVLVLLSTSIVTGRYARYITIDSAADSARVAAFVFDVRDTNGHVVDLTKISKPGDSKTFQFKVSNNTNGVVSEVEEEYVLTMELRGSLPLVCSLDGGDQIQLKGQDIGASGVVSAQGNIQTFEASVSEDIIYTLTVTWPGDLKDVIYSRAGIAQLVVTIAAQQTD